MILVVLQSVVFSPGVTVAQVKVTQSLVFSFSLDPTVVGLQYGVPSWQSGFFLSAWGFVARCRVCQVQVAPQVVMFLSLIGGDQRC